MTERDAIEMACMYLEKQIPKKIIHRTTSYNCPTCGYIFFSRVRGYKHCHNCGQKLDWNI